MRHGRQVGRSRGVRRGGGGGGGRGGGRGGVREGGRRADAAAAHGGEVERGRLQGAGEGGRLRPEIRETHFKSLFEETNYGS